MLNTEIKTRKRQKLKSKLILELKEEIRRMKSRKVEWDKITGMKKAGPTPRGR